MQVHPRMRSPQFHSHGHPVPADQNHAHPNGVHSDPRPRYPTSNIDHLNSEDMNPYQQHGYGGGNGPPQQHQYHANPNNQLPPMYPTMSMPPPMPHSAQGIAGTSTTPHPPVYPAVSSSGLPPPGPAALAAQTQEGPKSLSGRNDKYRFELRVEQQPQRARMCGFGDKDRRPITPPPCVRLLIFDVRTGNRVPHDQIDGSFFVLQVDLWDEEATREVNLVRSSTSSPAVSISTATTTSYPPTASNETSDRVLYQPLQPGVYPTSEGLQVLSGPMAYPVAPPRMYPPPPGSAVGYPGYYPPGSYVGPGAVRGIAVHHINTSTAQHTRNLIGSLTVNAASLKDTEGKMGFWFVLQDLSVRTEGWFRLKMNFIDVGLPNGSGLNKQRAPVLAFVYSDKFQVYSAKKFPGVIESTPLSKCFAGQGIKIPIRKDQKVNDGDEED